MFAAAEPPLPTMSHHHSHFAGAPPPFHGGPLSSCGPSAGPSGEWGFGPRFPPHHPHHHHEHEPFHGVGQGGPAPPPHHPRFFEDDPFLPHHLRRAPGRQLPGHLSPPMFPMDGMSPPHPSLRSFGGAGPGNGFPHFAPSPPHPMSHGCPYDSPPHYAMGMRMGMGVGGMPLCSLRGGPAPPPLVSVSSSTSSTSSTGSTNNFCSGSSSSSSSGGDSRFSSPERGSPFGPGCALSPDSSCKSSSPARGSPPPSATSAPPSPADPAPPLEPLQNLADPHYYMVPTHAPDCQVVVLTSRIKEKIPALSKTRWLDQQLSYRQCPYPIHRIEFTHAGDAVVQFISPVAMAKALARPPLLWGGHAHQEIGTRSCTEDDIAALFWVGITGATPDLVPAVRQALQSYGEVRGQYAPHPSAVGPAAHPLRSDLNTQAPEFLPGRGALESSCAATPGVLEAAPVAAVGSPAPAGGPRAQGTPVVPLPSQLDLSAGPAQGVAAGGAPGAGILKLYFAPSGRRRLPATIHIHLPERPKSCAPLVARVFTPHGPLAPKCADFGAGHAEYGCPDCFKRSLLPLGA